jgi:hypothetical protein
MIEIHHVERGIEESESDPVKAAAVLHSGERSLVGCPGCWIVVLRLSACRSVRRLCPIAVPQYPAPQHPVIEGGERR